MSVLETIFVDLSVVLGTAEVPIRQVLKMGRGAMVALDSNADEPTLVYVNDELIAKGRILVNGDAMSLEVTEVVKKLRG
jgi:flagellar motor switch protein FliN/FliY